MNLQTNGCNCNTTKALNIASNSAKESLISSCLKNVSVARTETAVSDFFAENKEIKCLQNRNIYFD